MTVTPLDVTGFMGFYKVDASKVVAEYHRYLMANLENHHYNGLTMDQWYTKEIQQYIDDLVKENKDLS
jgi:hypothetical protein